MTTGTIPSSLRYWYGASLPDFIATGSATVLGQLTSNCNFTLQPTQRDAWLIQLDILRAQFQRPDRHNKRDRLGLSGEPTPQG